MEKYCKVICTYFGPRHIRNTNIGWPRHGQYFIDSSMCLDNLKFIVDVETNLDAGLPYDLIIVNNDSGFEEGKNWLNSINEKKTKCGKIYTLNKENKGKNYSAFRVAYETFRDKYDFFMFIPDDYVMLAKNYYKETVLQYREDNENDNTAVIALAGISDIRYWPVHSHDGMTLIHKKYIEEGIQKYGRIPSDDDELNYISSDDSNYIDVIPGHVDNGEIPFTNRYVQLGYKITPFGYIHTCEETDYNRNWEPKPGDTIPALPEYRASWPVRLNNEIYLTPTYNLLHDVPNKVDVEYFKLDEDISFIVKSQIEKIRVQNEKS